MPISLPIPAPLTLVVATLLMAGCAGQPPRATDALPANASPETVALAETKDMLDRMDPAPAAPAQAFALTGRGFAQVAGQPGKTLSERRLLAMRAARLDALRDLTEQVHGIRISTESLLRDAVLQNDALSAHVSGTLRGARTVSIEPRGEDGYAVVMELDPDTVAYILRAVGSGA